MRREQHVVAHMYIYTEVRRGVGCTERYALCPANENVYTHIGGRGDGSADTYLTQMFEAHFHAANMQIEFLFVLHCPIERRPEFGDVAAVFVGLTIIRVVRGRWFPSNVVFRLLFDEPDPFENVCDIIDTSLLYM